MANLLPTVYISGTVILVYDVQVRREKKEILCIVHNVYFSANL